MRLVLVQYALFGTRKEKLLPFMYLSVVIVVSIVTLFAVHFST